MVSVDPSRVFGPRRRHPSAARAATDPNRSQTLDAPIGEGRRRQKADTGRIAKLLSGLVRVIEGRDLGQIVPMVSGLPEIVGIGGRNTEFSSFLDGFIAAVGELGLVGPVPRARADDENGRILAARGLGVSAHTSVPKGTPRSVRRFDEFAAMFSDSPRLADAIAAGNADGLPIGVTELVSAMLGALRAAALMNDTDAMRQVGIDFGALAAALAEVAGVGATTAERAVGATRRVRVQKATNKIVGVQVGDEIIPIERAIIDPRTGRVRRRLAPKMGVAR